jgi:aminoglycoside 6'-N-acetyltransferase I
MTGAVNDNSAIELFEFEVRQMKTEEWRSWAQMRAVLYEISSQDASLDCQQFITGEHNDLKVVFVGVVGQKVMAFAEVAERSYADGCYDGPVAYLEGLFVDAEYRNAGIGLALFEATVIWAKSKNYPHLASGVALGNVASQHVHEACGFEEIDCIVHYRMKLK